MPLEFLSIIPNRFLSFGIEIIRKDINLVKVDFIIQNIIKLSFYIPFIRGFSSVYSTKSIMDYINLTLIRQ